MKCVQEVIVKNPLGLHTRPATFIVKLLQGCCCDVKFTYNNETVDAKSILSILMLAAIKNSSITVICEGSDADIILKKLVAAFETEFGEGS